MRCGVRDAVPPGLPRYRCWRRHRCRVGRARTRQVAPAACRRRARWLQAAVAVADAMLTLPGPVRLEISFGDPLKVDLSDAAAVVSAAGDALAAQIPARPRRHRIPVNVVDRPELSTFIFPAIVD